MSTDSMSQAPGSDGCLSGVTYPPPSCSTNLRGLYTPHAVAVSPDGKSVYVSNEANDGALIVFDRDESTGFLTQKSGTDGCIVEAAYGSRDQSCGTGRLIGSGFGSGANVVVSPDGKNVYLASGNYGSISVFDRNLQTGALTQKTGSAGCIHNTGESIPAGTSGCDGTGRAMSALVTLAVTPDGTNVYGSTWSQSVVVFDRDTTSGALTQKAGAAGCYVPSALAGCTIVSAFSPAVQLTQTQDLLVSNDGNHVYVTSYTGGRIWVFGRDTSNSSARGTLGVVACVKAVGVTGGCSPDFRGLATANHVSQSPDGSTLYVVGSDGGGIAILRRDAATGLLTQGAGTAGCIADPSVVSTPMWSGCSTARGLGTSSTLRLAVGADTAYVASSDFDAILVLDRSTVDGSLSQTSDSTGCFSSSQTVSACTQVVGTFNPTALSLYTPAAGSGTSSPTSLYVSATTWSAPWYDALTVFTSGSSSSSGPPSSSSSPNNSAPAAAVTQIFRVALDPNGGTCVDSGTSRSSRWTAAFVGHRYLPGTSDCRRNGYVFAGWAHAAVSSTVAPLPVLVDPASDTRRPFLAADADLVAVWSPLPATITDLTVFANFLCGPCTNAWLLFTMPDHVTDFEVAVNGRPATCTQKGQFFELALCELTGLAPGTSDFDVTPRNPLAHGATSTTRVILRT